MDNEQNPMRPPLNRNNLIGPSFSFQHYLFGFLLVCVSSAVMFKYFCFSSRSLRLGSRPPQPPITHVVDPRSQIAGRYHERGSLQIRSSSREQQEIELVERASFPGSSSSNLNQQGGELVESDTESTSTLVFSENGDPKGTREFEFGDIENREYKGPYILRFDDFDLEYVGTGDCSSSFEETMLDEPFLLTSPITNVSKSEAMSSRPEIRPRVRFQDFQKNYIEINSETGRPLKNYIIKNFQNFGSVKDNEFTFDDLNLAINVHKLSKQPKDRWMDFILTEATAFQFKYSAIDRKPGLTQAQRAAEQKKVQEKFQNFFNETLPKTRSRNARAYFLAHYSNTSFYIESKLAFNFRTEQHHGIFESII